MRLGCLNGAGECNRVIKIIFLSLTFVNNIERNCICKCICCSSIKSCVKFYFWNSKYYISHGVKKVNWVWWQFVCLGAIALCWTQSDGSKCQFSTRNPTLIFQQSQNPDSGPHGSKIIARLWTSQMIYEKTIRKLKKYLGNFLFNEMNQYQLVRDHWNW